jgi:hypothetical protein
MKKLILTSLLALAILVNVSAQQWTGTNPLSTTSNVGIGTPTPKSKLHINSWANNSDPKTARQLVISGDDWGGMIGTEVGPVANKYGLEIGYNYNYYVATSRGGRIQAYSNGVENLNLNPDGGNVGIGTYNPTAKLEVLSKAPTTSSNDVVALFTKPGAPFGGSAITRFGIPGNCLGDIEINSAYSNANQRYGTYADMNIVNNGYAYGGTAYGAINLVTNGSTKLTITPLGNVGIGTPNPGYKLDVAGSAKVLNEVNVVGNGDIGGVLRLYNNAKTAAGQASNWSMYNMSGQYGNSLQFWAYDNIGCVSGGMCGPKFTILDNGNIGIGTSTPQAKLDVNGSIKIAGNSSICLTTTDNFIHNGLTLSHYSAGWYEDYSQNANGPTYWVSSYGGIKLFTGGALRMIVHETGKVGIGTTDFSQDGLLIVNGKIIAKEVEVKDVHADFVFEKGYKLNSLSEVEAYINANQHLPGVAPASETSKGVELAKFNTLLLQKIEELTLYMIEQNKRIDKLELENTSLKNNQ